MYEIMTCAPTSHDVGTSSLMIDHTIESEGGPNHAVCSLYADNALGLVQGVFYITEMRRDEIISNCSRCNNMRTKQPATWVCFHYVLAFFGRSGYFELPDVSWDNAATTTNRLQQLPLGYFRRFPAAVDKVVVGRNSTGDKVYYDVLARKRELEAQRLETIWLLGQASAAAGAPLCKDVMRQIFELVDLTEE